MKESNYKSYDELPLFLNAATVAKVLGIAPSSSYELMHERIFLRSGSAIGLSFRRKRSFAGWSSTRERLNEARSLANARLCPRLLSAAEGNLLAGPKRS